MGCGHVKKNKGNYLVAVLEIFTFFGGWGGGGGGGGGGGYVCVPVCLCACVDTG